jgi:hypothetical protein
MSMTPEQLQQLEALCERLYNSAEPNERAHAEQVCVLVPLIRDGHLCCQGCARHLRESAS